MNRNKSEINFWLRIEGKDLSVKKENPCVHTWYCIWGSKKWARESKWKLKTKPNVRYRLLRPGQLLLGFIAKHMPCLLPRACQLNKQATLLSPLTYSKSQLATIALAVMIVIIILCFYNTREYFVLSLNVSRCFSPLSKLTPRNLISLGCLVQLIQLYI